MEACNTRRAAAVALGARAKVFLQCLCKDGVQDLPLLSVSAIKVTSKGAGLNPNAKVWQEMPVASREVVANSSHWPPSDISDGERQHRSSKRSTTTTTLGGHNGCAAVTLGLVSVNL